MKISAFFKRNLGACRWLDGLISTARVEDDGQRPILCITVRGFDKSAGSAALEITFDELRRMARYVGLLGLPSDSLPDFDGLELEDEPREVCAGVAPIVNDGDSAPMLVPY